MRRRVSALPALMLVSLGVLGACSSTAPGVRTPDPDDAATTSASTPSPVLEEYAAAVAFARQEVHDRFGHPVEEIELVSAEPVRWPDSSLGCPRTEETYEPGPVEGYRLVLRWEDVRFDYHGKAGTLPFHCMFLDG